MKTLCELRKNYRIISNGKVFRIQKCYKLFGVPLCWKTLEHFNQLRMTYEVSEFYNKESAEDKIKTLINTEFNEWLNNQWKVV